MNAAMPKKTVFISHPIAGDVKRNVKHVLQICADVHTGDIIPVAPYLASLQYLDDDIVEDRALGTEANHECIRRKYVDEVWLFGDRISSGMEQEIALAKEMGIPIFPKTAGTRRDWGRMAQR